SPKPGGGSKEGKWRGNRGPGASVCSGGGEELFPARPRHPLTGDRVEASKGRAWRECGCGQFECARVERALFGGAVAGDNVIPPPPPARQDDDQQEGEH